MVTLRSAANQLHRRLNILSNDIARHKDAHTSTIHVFNANAHYRCETTIICRPYSSRSQPRLIEVGRFTSLKDGSDLYPSGQLFVHRVFGYRGVIVFSWLARVNESQRREEEVHVEVSDKSSPQYAIKTSEAINRISTSDISKPKQGTKNVVQDRREKLSSLLEAIDMKLHMSTTKLHPYYQVLIDARDCSLVSRRVRTDAVTYLSQPNDSRSVDTIEGLDYVAHEDILPYSSKDKYPIHNKLLDRFFCKVGEEGVEVSSLEETRYEPTQLLYKWQDRHPWIELSQVYKETTENVRVTVMPFYLGQIMSRNKSRYWWRYCIRLENLGDLNVQLRGRLWKRFCRSDRLKTDTSRGVNNEEPILSRDEPAYQYASLADLPDASGRMWGHFKMEREDGHKFECKIPPFSLESAVDSTTPPNSKRNSTIDTESNDR